MIWFIADTHWGHGRILEYCSRPFQTCRDHDETIISNWNSCINKTDTVYHLGDFGFGSKGFLLNILEQLNGKIHLICGNHDRRNIKGILIEKFASIEHYKELNELIDPKTKKRQRFILCHYPMLSWNAKSYGSIMLHGHSHGKLPQDNPFRIDVGVDSNNFFPVSLDSILKKLQK